MKHFNSMKSRFTSLNQSGIIGFIISRWLVLFSLFVRACRFFVIGLWFIVSPAWADDASGQTNSAISAPNSPSRVVVMSIKGPISRNLVEKVKSNLAQVQGDPIPAGFIVLIDSKGGDGVAAMKIGKMLRDAKAHVFVNGDCASACVFILASGVVRGASAYSVGIHRGRITISDDNAKVIKEVDLDEDPKAKLALERFESASILYFKEMGLPPDFYHAMKSHKYKGVYRLSYEELIFYGLIGIEDQYLKHRSAFYEQQKGAFHMSKDEFHRRTLRVGTMCAPSTADQNAFVKCYKDSLKDPY